MLTLAVRSEALMRIDVNDASTENEMAYSTTEKPCLGLVPGRSYPWTATKIAWSRKMTENGGILSPRALFYFSAVYSSS